MRSIVTVAVTMMLAVSTVGTAPAMGLQAAVDEATPIQTQQSGQASGQVLGNPDISLGTTQRKFSAGTTTEFQVTVINRGDIQRAGPSEYENRVTTARGMTITIRDEGTPLEVNTGTIAVGNAPTGTVQSGPIEITIPESVRPGVYTIPVEYAYDYTRIVSYDSSGAEYNDFTAEERGSITIRVQDEAQFSVVSQDTVGQVGDTSEIRVTLENTGTQPAASASVVATTESDELSFGTESGSSTAFAAEAWEPGEQRSVNYTISLTEDATQRAYTLGLTVDYANTDGIAQSSQPLTIGVQTIAAQSFEAKNIQSSLRVGQDGRLAATIVNEGPQAIRNPVVTLSTNSQSININSPEYAISDLSPGEEEQVNYTVSTSGGADTGVQQFAIEVSYNNQDGDRQTSSPIQINAPLEQQIDRFRVEAVNQSVTTGQTTELTLRITNNGDETLRSIDGQAFFDGPLSSNDDEVFIARLDPGETTTVSIELSIASGALNKTYPFTMDFQYEMPDGDTEISKTYNVPIQAEQAEESGGLQLPLIGGIGAVVLVTGGVWYVRRRQGAGNS